MSIERVVAFLTPVFAIGAGWLSGAVAKYGLHIDPTGIVALEATGVATAAAAALKWLHGRAAWTKAVAELKPVVVSTTKAVAVADPNLASELKTFVQGELAKLKADLTSEDPAPIDTTGVTVQTTPPVVGDQASLAAQFATAVAPPAQSPA